jgi:hypothetical protein
MILPVYWKTSKSEEIASQKLNKNYSGKKNIRDWTCTVCQPM